MKRNGVYFFDYQATTPVDKRVRDVLIDVLENSDGNPHSNSHQMGWHAADIVQKSRRTLAQFINADMDEIIFTSGATESNNLALKGIMAFYGDKKNHLITVETEHKCILESVNSLQSKGYEITILKVDNNGLINLDELKNSITSNTALVSIMAVNNETGVIQNLKKIGEITRNSGVFFHVDAAQGYGKIDIDVKDMNIDLLSVSSHKIYGPKGIGILYVGKDPRVKLESLFSGGGQERGMRSGTIPVFLTAGMAKAAEIIFEEKQKETERLLKLKEKFLSKMLKIPETYLNGSVENTIPQCSNISFLDIEGEGLLGEFPEICVSTGSACNSAKLEPSYVITALHNGDTYYAHSAIRFGFGRFTTEEDVDYLIERISNAVIKKRKESPLWEMRQKGIDINMIQWDCQH